MRVALRPQDFSFRCCLFHIAIVMVLSYLIMIISAATFILILKQILNVGVRIMNIGMLQIIDEIMY